MLLKTHFNRIWFAFQLFSKTLLHYNNKVKSVADDCHSTLTFPVDASSFDIILYFGFVVYQNGRTIINGCARNIDC